MPSLFSALCSLPPGEKEALIQEVEGFSRQRGFLHCRDGRLIPHPIALTPFVLDEALVPTLHALARAVHRFQARVPQLYADGVASMRRLCPLGVHGEAWFLKHFSSRPSHQFMLRLDVGFSQEGRLVVYENNATALAGLYNHYVGVQALRSLVFPRLGYSGLQNPPDTMAFFQDFLTRYGGVSPLIAFVEDVDPADYSELPQIASYLQSHGVPALYGDVAHLRVVAGKTQLQCSEPSVVWRDLNYQETPYDPGRFSGLMHAMDRVIPSFASEFEHKGLLECFTSEEYASFFSPSERRLLEASVPWTRVLWPGRQDADGTPLVDLAIARQDEFILKPNRESCGKDIVIGRHAAPEEWRRAVQAAASQEGGFVLQHYVEGPTQPMVILNDGAWTAGPCFFTLGLFYFDDKLALHCRVSPSRIVNVARGGALACVMLGP